MNNRPIEQALDNDLRLSHAALQRAAKRAHELAAKTGTPVVVSRNGVVEYLKADSLLSDPTCSKKPRAPYDAPSGKSE